MKQKTWLAALAVAVASTWTGTAALRGEVVALDIQHVVDVTEPTFVTFAPGDPSRIFYVARAGVIHIIKDGVVLPDPFLDISAQVDPNNPEGALGGLAFHPDYANNGWFYVTYMNLGDDSVLSRFCVSADPDVADPDSESILLTVEQPDTTHNVGWIGFGPDGYLYVGSGDGGNGTLGVWAQNIESLLGKILRIDVNGTPPYGIPADNPFVGVPGRDEIWALGLRNPWRCSFDRLTNDFWIGDVGQSSREEIDFLPAGSPAPANFGWSCMEGLICHVPATGCTCGAPGLIAPVHSYTHTVGCASIGGYVYRGSAIPSLVGHYIFGDVCTGKIWERNPANGVVTQILSVIGLHSFGEDAQGELYIMTPDSVFKIVFLDCNGNGAPDSQDISGGFSADCDTNGIPDECAVDCNENLIPDACDIASGTSIDSDGNGIPDECDDLADLNHDGHVGIQDLLALLTNWGPCPPACPPCLGDINQDCSVGILDFLLLLSSWG